MYAISGFGDTVNKHAGATVPVNFAALVPDLDNEATVLMNLTFM